jgi:hypothetical protein
MTPKLKLKPRTEDKPAETKVAEKPAENKPATETKKLKLTESVKADTKVETKAAEKPADKKEETKPATEPVKKALKPLTAKPADTKEVEAKDPKKVASEPKGQVLEEERKGPALVQDEPDRISFTLGRRVSDGDFGDIKVGMTYTSTVKSNETLQQASDRVITFVEEKVVAKVTELVE